MTSYPLIITRNKHNSLQEAIVASLVTLILSLGISANWAEWTWFNILYIFIVIFGFVGSIILWYRFVQKNQVLVKITKNGIAFKEREILWVVISSYRIKTYTSSEGGDTYNIIIALKDGKESKFSLSEHDVPSELLLKVFGSFAQIHKFSFRGTSLL